ncbi:MAG: hypothetical protein HKN21_15570 [Candidatus Eisenbacteria bacterium]|uniref:Uncharacterized protein n=1 Tax=Eiseniibacteriota bacterium TaxID=2212470 RepID=A0A7Y2H3W7_UNCEI|nr:hypothetical protein [Candidatus Eisenbacteria bacterium]
MIDNTLFHETCGIVNSRVRLTVGKAGLKEQPVGETAKFRVPVEIQFPLGPCQGHECTVTVSRQWVALVEKYFGSRFVATFVRRIVQAKLTEDIHNHRPAQARIHIGLRTRVPSDLGFKNPLLITLEP